MIGTLKKCRICTSGGLLAAILIAAVFASSQVTCLTHTHCHESDCFDDHQESYDSHEHSHDDDCDSHNECDEEHQDHDIHHHSHDGKTHPQRRFTAPVFDTEFADAAVEETHVSEPAGHLPDVDESPPLERYGPIFAERAPPLS